MCVLNSLCHDSGNQVWFVWQIVSVTDRRWRGSTLLRKHVFISSQFVMQKEPYNIFFSIHYTHIPSHPYSSFDSAPLLRSVPSLYFSSVPPTLSQSSQPLSSSVDKPPLCQKKKKDHGAPLYWVPNADWLKSEELVAGMRLTGVRYKASEMGVKPGINR